MMVELGRHRGLLSAAAAVVKTPLTPSAEPMCEALVGMVLVSSCVACESQFVMWRVDAVLVSVHLTNGMILLVES